MIIELLCSPLFAIINGIIMLMPSGLTIPDWGVSFISLIQKALFFFPPDVLTTVVAVVIASYGAQFVWAIIEWVYKKLPCVN